MARIETIVREKIVPALALCNKTQDLTYGATGYLYALLALVVGLTIYSIFVTLQSSNEKYGGCTKDGREDDLRPEEYSDSGDRLRPGAVYDPATDQWILDNTVNRRRVAAGSRSRSPSAEPRAWATGYCPRRRSTWARITRRMSRLRVLAYSAGNLVSVSYTHLTLATICSV